MRIAAMLVIAVAASGLPGCAREKASREPEAAERKAHSRDQGNGTSRVTRATPAVSAPVQVAAPDASAPVRREWGPGEHVQPGSSLENGTRQEIRLNSVTELREIPNRRLWFAGFGGARVNGGSALFSWNSVTPPPLEIEVANDGGERFLECERLVKAGVPHGKVLGVTGRGTFRSVPAGGTWTGSFRLFEIEACGLQ